MMCVWLLLLSLLCVGTGCRLGIVGKCVSSGRILFVDGVILVVVVVVDVEVSVVWSSIGMTTVLGGSSSRSTEMRSCPGSSNDRMVEATSPSCAPRILVMPISSELYVGKPGSVWYMGGGSLSGTIASPGPIPRVNI